MAAVGLSLLSRVLGREIKKFGAFLLKMYFLGILGLFCPLLPSPGYAYGKVRYSDALYIIV